MSHHHADLFENRKQFQIERLILFSDAVFAIAITLLVIEIRVPAIQESVDTSEDLINALLHMFPEFFGFLLSFAVIGQFWTNHHRLFGFVNNYNGRLLWLNLLMLFWIVLVPFTSGLNSKYGNLNLVWRIYSLNLFMIAISLYILYRYIGNKKNQLSDLAEDSITKRFSYYRSLGSAFIFLLGAMLSFIDGAWGFWLARMVFFLIPIVIVYFNRRAKKIKKLQAKG